MHYGEIKIIYLPPALSEVN